MNQNFNLRGGSFYVIAFFLGILSFVFGYLFSNYALKPLFLTNRLLDNLIKNTLHELNIPIATIKANVQMLSAGENDEKKLKRFQRISKASDDLFKLYKDMDYYIKKEIQKVTKEEFYLKEVVRNEIKKFDDIKNSIKINLDDFEDVLVYADKEGFLKTLGNLISNAIKYNKIDGKIDIGFKNNALYIKDTGIGMDEGEIFRIYDRYYQAEHGKSGYGIGLNMVKGYCDEHKISINIRSKKGEGSEFMLNISPIIIK